MVREPGQPCLFQAVSTSVVVAIIKVLGMCDLVILLIKQWKIVLLRILMISALFAEACHFPGGDPLLPANLEAVLALVKRVKAECENKDIWLWTGYVLGDLSEQQKAVLTYIDVLVDGKFEQSLADPSLPFRGSSNQIIRLL